MNLVLLAAAGVGVWWHWMGYEITRSGIERDLKAMESCEVADATIFAIATHSGFWCAKGIENVPDDKVSYWNDEWWKLVRYAVEEGKRRNISMGMQCSPGYTHTGGPWITPENAMKKLVWSDDGSVPKHDARFYRDIATVEANGKRYRFGYTLTGATSGPAPDDIDGKCLEADKLSAKAMRAHVEALMGGIRGHLGELVGNGFDFLVMDSYEAGEADWTDDFAEEFKKRRGYDLTGMLPVLAGEAMEGADKFRQDFAAVRAELFMERCLATMREAAQAAKLRLRIEPYDLPCDSAAAAKYADEPMIEFWAEGDILPRFLKPGEKVEYPIVGAEAFTSDAWTADFSQTPKDYKTMADRAFALGVNHLCLHDWVHQPFSAKWRPGLSMGFFGTHFGENQTWFEQGKAFFKYLKNCQRELRRGVSVRAGLEMVPGVVGCERRDGEEMIYFLANTNSVPVGVKVEGGDFAVYRPETEDRKEGQSGEVIGLSEQEAVVVRGKALSFSRDIRHRRDTRFRVIDMEGPWEIAFEPGMGAPAKPIVLKDLRSLSEIDLPGVKYFSGTATYRKEFWMNKPPAGKRVFLALGDVREMVTLKVNGRELGVRWHEPFEYELTEVVNATELSWGKVRLDLEIAVVNTWHNRLVGDNFEEDDCEWHSVNPRMSGPKGEKLSGRGIRRIPDFVLNNWERPSRGRIGWSDWDYFALDTELLPAGLLGPVRVKIY